MHDIIIVGAGPAGLSASLHAKELGLDYLTIEKEKVANTIWTYPPGKPVQYYPAGVEVVGNLPLPEGKTEDVIAGWQKFAKDAELNVKEHEGATNIVKQGGEDGTFKVETDKGAYEARFVILAIGVQGTVRKVPIECDEEDKVCYALRKPEMFAGKSVIVVGGGDTAIESAMLLKDAGADVTISYRKPEFFRLKDINKKNLEKSGIPVIFNSNVKELKGDEAIVDVNGEPKTVDCDYCLVFAGTIPPTDFMTKIGLELENNKPKYNSEYESNVPGLFIAGDLTKEPLIKPAVNHGYKIVETVAKRLGKA